MNDIESLYRNAVAEHRAGRADMAESLCRQILTQDQGFASAWHLLGLALYQQGDTRAAVASIQRAIGLEPQQPSFYVNLASIHRMDGHLRNAELALRRVLDSSPDYKAAIMALGQVLCEQNRCDEAVHIFQRVVALDPQDAAAHGGLGYAYGQIGLIQESLSAFRRASELSPDPTARILAATHLPIVYASRQEVLAWRERFNGQIDALLAAGVKQDLTTRAATPVFAIAHQGLNDVEIQRKLARLYEPPMLPQEIWQPRTEKKIRVGFISSFFREHTIGKLFRGLITRLSRSDFHVTLFSIGIHDDALARELAAAVDRTVFVSRDLARARQTILENSVDVLIYTDIGMDQTTYSLAFSRLAPVQCTSWGHSNTTGLETIDYFLSSDHFEVPAADTHYSEQLVRMPGLTLVFDRAVLPSKRLDRAALGLDASRRLYACPQSIYKFHPDFDAALAGILRRDPEGQVVLLSAIYPQLNEQLQRRFAQTMPDVAERIVFTRRLEQDEFYHLLTLIDVMLDPFPYGGCTSSLEGFSFGVPVVTLPTEFLRGRFTQAFYRRLGVEVCIASDVENYIDIAVRLATDLSFRHEIHERILAGQPQLFDDDSAIRDWEDFLRKVAPKL